MSYGSIDQSYNLDFVDAEQESLLVGGNGAESMQSNQQTPALSGDYSTILSRGAAITGLALLVGALALSDSRSLFEGGSASAGVKLSVSSLDNIPRDTLFANFSEPEQQQLFAMFLEKYGKTYSKDEYGDRFKVFKKQLDKVDSRNAQEGRSSSKVSSGSRARHGITKFSDMTDEEFSSIYLTARQNKEKGKKIKVAEMDDPALGGDDDGPPEGKPDYSTIARTSSVTAVDWTDTMTTSVKDQGMFF